MTQAITEGLMLGAYNFDKYKSKKEEKRESEVILLVPAARLQHGANGAVKGQLTAQASIFARDLVNESPTVTTPAYLAQVARNLAKKDGIKAQIIDEKEARKMGMNSYLSVARGSSEPPKFIHLTYSGGGRKKIAVIGKSITFDTGGLSLKDAKNMETMKIDMSGGAAVLGLFSILPLLKPKCTVCGVLPATENMPGSKAIKPGDVVTAMNGKSIEILNTDAEGRMTLADAFVYAQRLKPDYIIDLATLTGACVVALGENIAGLWGNNTDLTSKVKTAAKIAGEKIWELPLEEEYRDQMKGSISDLRNIGKSRYGGSITGALFLQEFINNTPWVHLDIAGPAWEEKGSELIPQGGTGFGVRTLIEVIKLLS
jgi:leucyl aminopeptidase